LRLGRRRVEFVFDVPCIAKPCAPNTHPSIRFASTPPGLQRIFRLCVKTATRIRRPTPKAGSRPWQEHCRGLRRFQIGNENLGVGFLAVRSDGADEHQIILQFGRERSGELEHLVRSAMFVRSSCPVFAVIARLSGLGNAEGAHLHVAAALGRGLGSLDSHRLALALRRDRGTGFRICARIGGHIAWRTQDGVPRVHACPMKQPVLWSSSISRQRLIRTQPRDGSRGSSRTFSGDPEQAICMTDRVGCRALPVKCFEYSDADGPRRRPRRPW
jgi:hypothetical protein